MYTKDEIFKQIDVLADGMSPWQMVRDLMRRGELNYHDYQLVTKLPDDRSKNSKLLDIVLEQRDSETALPAITQSLRLLHPKLAECLRPASTWVLWLVITPSLAAHVVHSLPSSVKFNHIETGAGYLFRQAFLTAEENENIVQLCLVFPYDTSSPEATSKALTAGLNRFKSRDLVVTSDICTSDTAAAKSVIITAPPPSDPASPTAMRVDKAIEAQASSFPGTIVTKKPLTPQWEWEKFVTIKCDGVVKGPEDTDTAMENSSLLLYNIISNL